MIVLDSTLIGSLLDSDFPGQLDCLLFGIGGLGFSIFFVVVVITHSCSRK